MPRIEIESTICRGTDLKVAADNQKDAVRLMAFFHELPHKCPRCGAPYRLTYRQIDDNDYYGAKCLGKTPHQTTFGQHKKGDTLFYKNTEAWKTWNEIQNERDQPAQGGDAAEVKQARQQAKQKGPGQGVEDLGNVDDNLPF